MDNNTIQQHARDLVKAIIATAAVAAIQAIVQYLAHVNWPDFFTHGAQVAAAFGAIKMRV